MHTPRHILIATVAWLINHPELAGTVLTALVGSLGAAEHYRRTGKVPLRHLPWRALRRIFFELRRRWFSVQRPGKEPFVVDEDLTTVRERLGTESYNPRWGLSYRYMGEDLNARRYFFAPEKEFPHRQIHIRGFETEQGLELIAHEEPAPEHHPRRHLAETGAHDATAWVGEMWDTHNLDPRGYGSDGGSA